MSANNRYGKKRGFTLIELVAALVLVSLMLGIATPGITRMIANNQMVSEAQRMHAVLVAARSEAIQRAQPIVVCGSRDRQICDASGWSEGWIAFVDADGSGQPIRDLILREDVGNTRIHARGPGLIRFMPSGLRDLANDGNPQELQLTRKGCGMREGRVIQVLAGGRVQVMQADCQG